MHFMFLMILNYYYYYEYYISIIIILLFIIHVVNCDGCHSGFDFVHHNLQGIEP